MPSNEASFRSRWSEPDDVEIVITRGENATLLGASPCEVLINGMPLKGVTEITVEQDWDYNELRDDYSTLVATRASAAGSTVTIILRDPRVTLIHQDRVISPAQEEVPETPDETATE